MNGLSGFLHDLDLKHRALDTLPLSASSFAIRRFAAGSNPFRSRINETKSIFIHVPKAAGSTIKSELYGAPQYGHRRIVEFFAFDRQSAERFFKFAFVRNPWDRLLSAFSYLRSDEASTRDRRFARRFLADLDSFEDFVTRIEEARFRRTIMRYDHFRTQKFWVSLPGERGHRMDFLGRFENLEADMQRVREICGLPSKPMEHSRKSVHIDYRDAYTPRMRDVVQRLYGDDIELFGYEF